MKNHPTKRILAMLLAALMMVSLLPVTAFAEGEEEPVVVEEQQEDIEAIPDEEAPAEEELAEEPLEEPLEPGDPAVATIGETPYDTLAAAIENAASGNNIVLQTDVTTDADITVPQGVTLTIPEGKTLTLGEGMKLLTLGTLKLNGTISGAVAKVGSSYYSTFDGALAAWVNGTTLTLLADVTTTAEKKLEVCYGKPEYTLHLGGYTWTANGCNAINVYCYKDPNQAYGCLDGNKGLCVYANEGGGFNVTTSGKYAFTFSSDGQDGSITNSNGRKSGYRPRVWIYGGTYKGGFIYQGSYIGTNNGARINFYASQDGSSIYADSTAEIKMERGHLAFYNGTYDGKITDKVVGGTQYFILSKGTRFKSLPGRTDNNPTKETNCVSIDGSGANLYILYDEDYYNIVGDIPTTTNAQVPFASGTSQLTYWSNNYYTTNSTFKKYDSDPEKSLPYINNILYTNENTAIRIHNEVILSAGVTATQDKTITNTMTIDATAADSAYTGTMTLNSTGAKFIMKGKAADNVVVGSSIPLYKVKVTQSDTTYTYTVEKDQTKIAAKIGNTEYAAANDAITAAKAGNTVYLYKAADANKTLTGANKDDKLTIILEKDGAYTGTVTTDNQCLKIEKTTTPNETSTTIEYKVVVDETQVAAIRDYTQNNQKKSEYYQDAAQAIKDASNGHTVTLYAATAENKTLGGKGEKLTIVLGTNGAYTGTVSTSADCMKVQVTTDGNTTVYEVVLDETKVAAERKWTESYGWSSSEKSQLYQDTAQAIKDASNGHTVTLYAATAENKTLGGKGEKLTIVLGTNGSYTGTVSTSTAYMKVQSTTTGNTTVYEVVEDTSSFAAKIDSTYYTVANDAINAATKGKTVYLYAAADADKVLTGSKGEKLTIVLGTNGSYTGTVTTTTTDCVINRSVSDDGKTITFTIALDPEKAEAKVGDTYYATTVEAIQNADGKTVVLLKDVTDCKPDISYSFWGDSTAYTLDLNGHSFSYATMAKDAGSGFFDTKYKTHNITVTDSVGGGSYGNAQNFDTKISIKSITGGAFIFDPTTYVPAEDYNITPETPSEGWWTVTEKPSVASVTTGEPAKTTEYKALDKAIAAATAGDTVKLLMDITGNVTVASGKDFTLDLNGHSVTGNISTSGKLGLGGGTVTGNVTADATGTLSVDSGVINGTVTLTTAEGSSISGGRFGGAVTATTASGIISGGYFAVSPAADLIASGYEIKDTTANEKTLYGATYLYTVGSVTVEPVVPVINDSTVKVKENDDTEGKKPSDSTNPSKAVVLEIAENTNIADDTATDIRDKVNEKQIDANAVDESSRIQIDLQSLKIDTTTTSAGIGLTQQVTTNTATYDVKPYITVIKTVGEVQTQESRLITNEELAQNNIELTFRLPVPSSMTCTDNKITVAHYEDGHDTPDWTKLYDVGGEGANRYVEITAGSFSEYELKENTFNVSGLTFTQTLELNANTNVRVYFRGIPDGTQEDDYTVKYTFNGETTEVTDFEIGYDTKNPEHKVAPIVNQKLKATQYTQPITLEILHNGVVVDTREYSVDKYCKYIINNPGTGDKAGQLVEVCKAIMEFGYQAQTRFKYMDNLPDKNYCTDASTASVGAEYAPTSVTGTLSNIKFTVALEMVDTTEFNYYIYTGGASDPIEGYTVSVSTDNVDFHDVTLTKSYTDESTKVTYVLTKVTDGKYRLKVKDQKYSELDQKNYLKVEKGNDFKTVGYSDMSFAYKQQSNATEGLLCKALYNYHVKAKTYFSNAN